MNCWDDNTIKTRGMEIVHQSRTENWERRWLVRYRIAGIQQSKECNGVDLEALLDWACDRADNATVVVSPVP